MVRARLGAPRQRDPESRLASDLTPSASDATTCHDPEADDLKSPHKRFHSRIFQKTLRKGAPSAGSISKQVNLDLSLSLRFVVNR